MSQKSVTLWCCFAGMLFGAAWWLFADISIWDNKKNESKGDMRSIVSYIPGILGTVGFFFVNMIPRSTFGNDEFEKEISPFRRFTMLIAFAVTFSSLISAFWIFFAKYTDEAYTSWVGVILLVQTVLIFISTYLFRFSRSTEDHSQYYY